MRNLWRMHLTRWMLAGLVAVIGAVGGSRCLATSDESEVATSESDAAAADVSRLDEAGPDDPQPDTAEPIPGEAAAPEPSAADITAGEATAAPPPARRIRMKLDVAGEIFAPAGRDVPPVRRPITVDARFDFVQVASVAAGDAERRYLDAAADVRIDDAVQATRLPADARRMRVAVRGATPMPYLADGFLTREELDLLETPFDPLLVDRVLPEKSVAVGDTWQVAPDAAAGLLAIDTVESGGIDARLEEVADGVAVVRLTGLVDGAADGVPTHVTVEGTCTIAAEQVEEGVRFTGGIASLAVTLAERREASHVAPGFDVEARITLASAVTAPGQEPESTSTPSRPGGAGRPGLAWHRDAAGRYDLVHDARWRVIEDGADGLVMRLLDHGALVAQCSITALPPAPSQQPPSIAEVERDLERSLAGQFGRLEHSSEASRSDGVRFVRVVASGRADGLAFRWIHHVLTDAAGHRLAVTCTLEEPQMKRFGAADRELVDGVSFPGEATSHGETVGEEPADHDRQALLPKESRTP